MDKFGKVKLALAAATALVALSGEPQMPSVSQLTEGIDAITTLPESVQETYRPMAQLARLPDLPLQRGDKSWNFWHEQIRRCRLGWTAPDGHYLTGYHYFYLNFMQIPIQDKEKGIAEWNKPYFRDNDETIFNYLWRNTSRKLKSGKTTNAKNHVEAKCRSIGWTQITLLGVAMWTFIFSPSRAVGMGYSDDEVINIERLWFQESWAKLHPMFRTWKGQLLQVAYNNKDTFSVGYNDKESGGIVKVHNSVQFKIIADKAGVFKGQRLNLIIAIEAGKWKGDTLKNYYAENLDCLEMGDYKWGMFLIGGTSNVIVNKSTNYKEIYFRHEAFNATRHFTSKIMCLTGFIDMRTGKSDVERAMKHILYQRKKKEADPQQYQQYIIENPLTDLECFTPNESFAYDTARIQAQIGFLKSNGFDTLWRRGRIEYEWDHEKQKRTGKIKFYEDPLGKWLINLEGLPNKKFKNLHIASLDDTYKGAEEENLRSKDSRNCMIIYRQPTTHNIKNDMPVAIFLHQTPDMDDIYEECLKGLKYYDVQQCLYEHNHDGFVKYLRDAGESRRLYWVNNKPGLSVKGKIKTELTFMGHTFFKEGRFQNITSIEILESLLVWGGKVNTDIGSAFHLILYLLDATKDWVVTQRVFSEEAMADIPSQRVVLGTTPKPAALPIPVVASGGDERKGGESWTGAQERKDRNYVKLGPSSGRIRVGRSQKTNYA